MRFARSIAQRNIPQNHLFIRTRWRNCPLGHLERPPALSGTASGLLERAKRQWNHLELWNGLRPFGTEPLALPGTREAPLEPFGTLERP